MHIHPPSRWRTGYRGVIKVAPLVFLAGFWGVFWLGKEFLVYMRGLNDVIFAVFASF